MNDFIFQTHGLKTFFEDTFDEESNVPLIKKPTKPNTKISQLKFKGIIKRIILI